MRKLLAWGFATVLLAGLASSRSAAKDDDDDDAQKPPPRPAIRWSPYFAGMAAYTQPKPEVKKPVDKPKTEPAKKTAEAAKPRPVINAAAAERAREEAVLMRRLEVCDKLKEIALRTNDNDLFRRAEGLDEQARAAYAQRTASRVSGGLESDDKALDRYFNSADSLKTRAPESSAHTVSASAQAGNVEFKEGNR